MYYDERRQSYRAIREDFSINLHPLDPQVWFRIWNGVEYSARDISLVGVGLFSREMIPEGTPLSLDIRLGRDSKDIRIFGKIVWVRGDTTKGFRSGISFSWWKEEADKKLVTDFINNMHSDN